MKSFLSEMVAKQPVAQSSAGKIRAGVKVPTKQVRENPEAMKIVAKISQGKISFSAAENEIKKKFEIKNVFFPKNTAYFSAHPWDMESGEVVSSKIMDMYGEVREGDPERRLYRFPVVFPSVQKNGGIDTILGSGLAVRGGGQNTIHYQSRYGDDGVRRCVYLPPVQSQTDVSRKQFSRREFVVRGDCDTSTCPQFASGECRFAGTLRFYIPEIPGGGVFSMDTGSTYGASDIYLRLSELIEEFGRLPSFKQNGQPVFWLTKALKTRNHPVLGKIQQWIPVLEMDVDMTKLKFLKENRTLLSAPSAAPKVSAYMPSSWVMDDEEVIADADGVISQEVYQTKVVEAALTPEDLPLSTLIAKSQAFGIEKKVLDWAELRFGKEWQNRVDEVLKSFVNITEHFKENTPLFLDLYIKLTSNGIDFQSVAVPYFKNSFNGIGSGANLRKMINHIDDLLEQGQNVALSFMQAKI